MTGLSRTKFLLSDKLLWSRSGTPNLGFRRYCGYAVVLFRYALPPQAFRSFFVMSCRLRPPHPSASQTPSPQGEGLGGRNALIGSSLWKGFVRNGNEIYGIRNMSLPLEGKVPNGVRRMRWPD